MNAPQHLVADADPRPDGEPVAQREITMRFGAYQGAVRHRQRVLSYNQVATATAARPRPTLRPLDVHRLVTPYVSVRFLEQWWAVLPLVGLLLLFQTLVLHMPLQLSLLQVGGVALVMVGLMCFMEGVQHGLMPFAENLGYQLPERTRLPMMLGIAFLLGAIATVADPAIIALKQAGEALPKGKMPLLYRLLNQESIWLVASMCVGVGFAVVLGVLRCLYGWKLKPLVLLSIVPLLVLSAVLGMQPWGREILALAWDCAAITAGPVAVPLVLALGIGMAASSGRESNPLSGFGIITLLSIWPVGAVLLLGMVMRGMPPPLPVEAVAATSSWLTRTPMAELMTALHIILPFLLLLWVVNRFVLGERVKHVGIVTYGVLLAILGLALFNVGLTTGLTPLGEQTGRVVPAAFSEISLVVGSPLYPYAAGIALTLMFGALLGYAATVAEPALHAIGHTVEELTDGAFPRRLLVHVVAFGVALGTALGVCKVLFGWNMLPLLLITYGLAALLTWWSKEEHVNLAWDAAAVTTGPVTVPLLLALGLSLSAHTGGGDGFGIMALASVGPVLSMLVTGMWVTWQTGRRQQEDRA